MFRTMAEHLLARFAYGWDVGFRFRLLTASLFGSDRSLHFMMFFKALLNKFEAAQIIKVQTNIIDSLNFKDIDFNQEIQNMKDIARNQKDFYNREFFYFHRTTIQPKRSFFRQTKFFN